MDKEAKFNANSPEQSHAKVRHGWLRFGAVEPNDVGSSGCQSGGSSECKCEPQIASEITLNCNDRKVDMRPQGAHIFVTIEPKFIAPPRLAKRHSG
jgi:hypothetical protein